MNYHVWAIVNQVSPGCLIAPSIKLKFLSVRIKGGMVVGQASEEKWTFFFSVTKSFSFEAVAIHTLLFFLFCLFP